MSKSKTDSKRHKKNKLLYRMAAHIANSGKLPATKWGVVGGGLLTELQELDPKAYDKRVKEFSSNGELAPRQRVASLPVADLRKLVGDIIDRLYLDKDGEHFPNQDFYNPDKEWDTETMLDIAELLKNYRLVPLRAQKA